jgi:hypothetical protein
MIENPHSFVSVHAEHQIRRFRTLFLLQQPWRFRLNNGQLG